MLFAHSQLASNCKSLISDKLVCPHLKWYWGKQWFPSAMAFLSGNDDSREYLSLNATFTGQGAGARGAPCLVKALL